MHEMSIVQELLNIIGREMATHRVEKLNSATIVYGRLTNIVPEALDFAWEALTLDTEFDGAELLTEELPLKLRCGGCKIEFVSETMAAAVAPCPECGEQFGHEVLQGRELFIKHIEAE